MKSFSIRPVRASDLPELVEVEKLSWESACSPEDQFTLSDFQEHFRLAPEWFYVAEDRETGKLLGYANGLRRNIPLEGLERAVTTWRAMSGEGTFSTHEPGGNAVFGASMGVIPSARGQEVASHLLGRLFEQAIRLRVEYGFLGGRLPGMSSYLSRHPECTPEEYFALKRSDGKPYDPELRLYSQDFQVLGLIPGYMEDTESCDYGVLLLWKTWFRWLPPHVGALVFKTLFTAIMAVEGLKKRRRSTSK